MARGGPALAEFAGGEDKNAVAGGGEVRNSGFHGTGAGGGKNDDVAGLGADKLFELGKNVGEKGAELGGAVMHIGRGHGELGSGEERRGAGSKEAGFTNHRTIVAGCAVGKASSAGEGCG